MTEATEGNPFGIDPGKIGYLGEGTGGYVSYAASTISDYNDIILDDNGAPIAKFWTGTTGQSDYIPMVIEAVNVTQKVLRMALLLQVFLVQIQSSFVLPITLDTAATFLSKSIWEVPSEI